MDLLERYLQAVGEHLPAGVSKDTLTELRVNLEAEIEGREEELGRSLNDAEIAQILEAHGMPVIVAGRYGPQQFLIGPGLFPFYWYTLKRSFPLVIAAYAVIQVLAAMATASSGVDFGHRIAAATAHFPYVALVFWAIMTLGFAAFEYVQGRHLPKFTLDAWSAKSLPPLQNKPKHSLTHRVADLIVGVLAIAWLLAIPDRPYLVIGPGASYVHGMPFGITPEWHIFYWQIITLLIAMLPFKTMALLPSFRRWTQQLDLVVQALGILVLVVLVQIRTFFVPGGSMAAENLKSLAGINAGITKGLQLALAIAVVKFCWDAWKTLTATRRPTTGYVAVK